jgi:hypothetical protein
MSVAGYHTHTHIRARAHTKFCRIFLWNLAQTFFFWQNVVDETTVIGLRQEAHYICTLLRFTQRTAVTHFPRFGPFSKTWPIPFPETSVNNYHYQKSADHERQSFVKIGTATTQFWTQGRENICINIFYVSWPNWAKKIPIWNISIRRPLR